MWSLHVDVHPGDRASACGGPMEPIDLVVVSKGFRVLHRCRVCNHQKWNKTALTDDVGDLIPRLTKTI